MMNPSRAPQRSVLRHDSRLVDHEPLLLGDATFVGDLRPSNCLELVVVRSAEAHAHVRELDVRPAVSFAGVRGVWTASHLANVGPLPSLSVSEDERSSTFPILASGLVRYVGEPIAAVVAENRDEAEDAAQQVRVTYDVLPVVQSIEQSLTGDVLLYPEWRSNVASEFSIGQGDVNAAFSEADLVVQRHLTWGRQTALPLETRGVLADYDGEPGRLTMRVSTQVPHLYRRIVSSTLNLPEERVRIVAPKVGGSFGTKQHIYPEDILVAIAAIETGYPVRFVEDRYEHFLATVHARDQVLDGQLALSGRGQMLGLRVEVLSDIGAHLHTVGAQPTKATLGSMCGPYKLAAYLGSARCIVTNKTPKGAYRGFGAPQAAWLMEALVDSAANELRIDPIELRMKNAVPATKLPYTSADGSIYDSGDFPRALSRILEISGYQERRRDQAKRRHGAHRVGIGVSTWVHGTGLGPSSMLANMKYQVDGYERVVVRIEPAGTVTIISGVAPQGQGTGSMMTDIASGELGIGKEQIRVLFGDTDLGGRSGMGHLADRGAAIGATAVWEACQILKEKASLVAAHRLGAGRKGEAVRFQKGDIVSAGSCERRISVSDVAKEAWLGRNLPEGVEPGLEATATYEPTSLAFTYGVLLVVVDVEIDTGLVEVTDVVMVNDCGVLINQDLVEGQIKGGVVQGIGDALLSEIVYTDEGQPLNTSTARYLVPTASMTPRFTISHIESPAPGVATGAKGAGETGIIGTPAAIALAIEDAVGAPIDRLPVTPCRLWKQTAQDA